MFRTKPLHVIDAEEKKEDLERTLGMFDLICLGMAATIGSGVFSTTGLMISTIAGPTAVLSWLIGGVVCIFNTFAYMELSTRIPSGDSTYAYSYHGIGELPAVIAAWLEYSIPAIFAQVDLRKTLFWNILISGILLTLIAVFAPFDTLWDIVNFAVICQFDDTVPALAPQVWLIVSLGHGDSARAPRCTCSRPTAAGAMLES
ncbi:hypothetical protein Gpo141_00010282 [Globisporangium polare]